ncbi:MAG TPA: polysaccharide biosynthesis tyrosine autokinase [Solirubrobacteraceae bacterium]|nr:polysaccharide biosynthesis tyrosine autokinase [Solirubrobacteraceae bacterium]
MAPDSAPDQQQDLRALLHVLWRRKWLVALLVVSLPVATYVVSASTPKEYLATAIVQVQGAAVDTSLFTTGPILPQTAAIAAAAQLAETPSVAREAAKRLNPRPQRLKALMDSLVVTSENDTGFVTLDIRDRNPQRAADVANAYADALVAARTRQARAQVNRTIQIVRQQLAAMGDADATGRAQLSEQLQRLRALEAAQTNNAVIVQPAVIPDSPASPKPLRNALLALVLGLLAGVGIALLLDRLDRRIRRTEDLRRLTDLPILTVIGEEMFRPRAHAPLHDSEPIRSLRAGLTYFNVDQPVRSIVVTSPGPSDGKSTVAASLAISLAHSGRDVILIDADLRRSKLAERLGISRSAPSLGSILASRASLGASLTEIDSDAGRLRVVPAGPPPPNPSELIDSAQMRDLLDDAESLADIVVIDSPPVLVVSDIVPVLRDVSGIILLVRMKRTNRHAVKRSLEIIELAGGSIFGLVATGAAEDESGYGYGYGYGYGVDGGGDRGKLIGRFGRSSPTSLVTPTDPSRPTGSAYERASNSETLPVPRLPPEREGRRTRAPR